MRKDNKPKRRADIKGSSDLISDQHGLPSTPSPRDPSSAPASTLRTRNSSNRISSSNVTKRFTTATEVAPQNSTSKPTHRQSAPLKDLYHRERKSLQLDYQASENIKPTYLSNRSPRSSLHNGSPGLITPPASASLSQSNSSSAPILPSFGANTVRSSSRNKLVKRSSSHRALNGGSNLYSSLRRPATSHQRSATLNYQTHASEYLDGAEDRLAVPIAEPNIHPPVEGYFHQWRPFFRTQAPNSPKINSAKRRVNGLNKENEPLATLAPDLNELPTLLLASSIDAPMPDENLFRRRSTISQIKRPMTPVPFADTIQTPSRNFDSDGKSMERPRTSFSLSEMFPSPSPSTWRMPRGASTHGKRVLHKHAGGRRIVSAPTLSKQRLFTNAPSGDHALGNSTQIYATPANHRGVFASSSNPPNEDEGALRSPLPPLQRLSSFKINLPETIPSYPATPRRRSSPPNLRSIGASAGPTLQAKPTSRQNQTQRPSGTQSEHASTLIGSETDNSRLSPGEQDDGDGWSSTAYDSTRTGASGSSQSASKRPHIDAIFDSVTSPQTSLATESPTTEVIHFDKLALDSIDDTPDATTKTSRLDVAPRADAAKVVTQQVSNSSKRKVGPLTSNGTLAMSNGDSQPNANPNYDLFGTPAIRAPYQSQSSTSAKPRRHTAKRRVSPTGVHRSNPFQWSEQSNVDKEVGQGDSARPRTVHGRQGQDLRGHRLNSRRGPSPLHLRSQSVPVPSDDRSLVNPTKTETWTFGKKAQREDWDGDFDFDESPRITKPMTEGMRSSLSSGMLVPKSILESQANVHGQFGQVKELTKLVEELKRLQQHARLHGIIRGQAVELWKEAEGIINLATVDDDDHNCSVPHTPSTDFDFSDDEAPTIRQPWSVMNTLKEGLAGSEEHQSPMQVTAKSPEPLHMETPSPGPLSRKESTAKAKSILENIEHQRAPYEVYLTDSGSTPRKLPFDTTSLKVLVTRAGVVTRALKEEIRKAESRSESPAPLPEHTPKRHDTPPDPPWSHVFHQSSTPQPFSKSPRITQSPRSPKSPRSSVLGGAISPNENDINGHMKVMTVV